MSHRAGLDQKAVVQAAAELVDRSGIEQLTLARLAQKLGIRVPSLYNHVAGLAGLRREMALLARQEVIVTFRRAATGKAGDEAILALANASRAYAKEHPGLYALAQLALDPDDSELQAASQEIVDIIVAVLAYYGLSDEDALHAVRGLRSIIHGFVSLETSGGFGLPLNLDESYYRLVKVFTDGLRQRYPFQH